MKREILTIANELVTDSSAELIVTSRLPGLPLLIVDFLPVRLRGHRLRQIKLALLDSVFVDLQPLPRFADGSG